MDSIKDGFVAESSEILNELKDVIRNYHSISDGKNMLKSCLDSVKLLLPSSKLMKLFVFHGHVSLIVTKLDEVIKNDSLEEHIDYFLTSINTAELALLGKDSSEENALHYNDTRDHERFKLSHTPIVFINIKSEDHKCIREELNIKEEYFIFENLKNYREYNDLNDNQIIFTDNKTIEKINEEREVAFEKVIVVGQEHKNYFCYNKANIAHLKIVYDLMNKNRDLEYFCQKSLSLVLFQFSDVEDFLINKEDLLTLDILKKEIKDLLIANKKIESTNK